MVDHKNFISKFLTDEIRIEVSAPWAIEGVHYQKEHLDTDSAFVATIQEKIMAILCCLEYAGKHGLEAVIAADTGAFRRFIEASYGIEYYGQLLSRGEKLRNVVVGKIASGFSLNFQYTGMYDPHRLLHAIWEHVGEARVHAILEIRDGQP